MQLALEVFTGAASGFLFPVLPASPTLFWFHNQHFFLPFRARWWHSWRAQARLYMHYGGNHKKTTFLFLEGVYAHVQKKKKCDSSACWLSAVGARRPLLCSCAMEQIYRLPSGVSSGLDCGSECPVPGFVRSPPFSSSSSILCFKGCRSSDMQTATH